MLLVPRRVRSRALWVGLGCLVAGITTAAGQAPNPQQPVFRGGVNVVPVEVVVVDGNGQAVHGLTQDSFRIFDRRQPQAVTVFEEVTRETSSAGGAAPAPAPAVHADVADNRTASSQRLVVMVIDDLHIDKAREDRTKDLAKQVVDRIGAGGSMAVLFTSRNHSTQVTEDRAMLLAAVSSLKAGQAERRPISVPETPGGRGNNGQAFFQNIQAFKVVADAARMLASDDLRRKTFVMLSEGVNKNMTGMFDYAMTPCEAHPPVATVAGQSPVVPCGASTELHQMMEDMRRSNVTMYIVDPRGAVSEQDLAKENFPAPGQIGAGGGGVTTQGRSGAAAAPRRGDSPLRQFNPVRVAEDGMNIMAEATGGFAVTNTDDFDAGLQMIADDLNHYYLLGFNPSDPSGAEYRRLDVSVAGHPDWVLRFRRGYLPGGPPAPPDGSDPLISGVTPKTDLPLRLIAVPLPATNGSANARVSVVLEVSAPRTALDAQGLLHDDVTYQVVAVLEKKAQATARVGNEAKLTLKPAGTLPPSGLVSYQIPASLDLAPGTYQLRASASSTLAGKAGSVYLTVDVPDFSVAPIAVSGLAVGYADGPHVATASSETPEADLGLPFVPSLDRTFAQTDSLRAYAEITRTNLTIPVKATASITAANGRPVVSAAVQEIGANQHGRVDATLSLAAVPPGAYTLSVTVTDGHHNASREVGIVVK
jgi:VWFA-related protein